MRSTPVAPRVSSRRARSFNRSTVVAALSLALTASHSAGAQSTSPTDSAAARQQQVLIGTRSPVGAGLLSYLLPGLGSYYAGNSKHGTVHLVVGLASGAALFYSLADCKGNCSTDEVISIGSGVTLAVNAVWSIFTAAQDADAYNAAASSRRVGELPLSVPHPLVSQGASREAPIVTLSRGSNGERRLRVRFLNVSF